MKKLVVAFILALGIGGLSVTYIACAKKSATNNNAATDGGTKTDGGSTTKTDGGTTTKE